MSKSNPQFTTGSSPSLLELTWKNKLNKKNDPEDESVFFADAINWL
jgi:hypothetical protein